MTIEQWLGEDNKIGQDIWRNKYVFTDDNGKQETFDEWLDRISAGNEDLKKLIVDKKFLFGGRILAYRGLADKGYKITYSNCYVASPPEDNIESIFETAGKLARTYSYGGGIGVDISNLAPKGAVVHNASRTSSGAVSFMDLYSITTGLIGQNGRRGALMISMSSDHPDIEEFIDVKKDLDKVTKANISIRMSDRFMQAAKDNKTVTLSFTRENGHTVEREVNARDILMKIAENNWDMGEPGMLFWDRINNWNLLSCDNTFSYAGTNPCFTGDMRLLTDKGFISFRDLYIKGEPVDIIGAQIGKIESKVWCSGEKETVVVKTKNREIKCTPDHIFMLSTGDRCAAKDLKGKSILLSYGDQTIAGDEIVDDVIPNGVELVYDFSMPINHWGIVEGAVVHNCAEEPLPAGGSCLLGSINLAAFVDNNGAFDFDDFRKTIYISIEALNNVLDEGMTLHPLKEQRDSVHDWRQIGLGIMGLADMLIKMKVRYGSPEAIDICDQIAFALAYNAIRASSQLSADTGSYPNFNREAVTQSAYLSLHTKDDPELMKLINCFGLRNSQLLTIAPTGTISTMIGVSGGIEPIFANHYTRKTESLKGHDEYYKVYTPIVQKYLDENGLDDDDNLPDYFVTAGTLDYKERICMQSVWQNHIDASISSTVNVPNDFTVEQVYDLYVKAWEAGLKGITVFRDGCRRIAILTTESPVEEKNDILPRGYVIPPSDDLIGLKRSIKTGCGTLHVEAFFTREGGELRELYLSKGSKGGCNSFMVGLSRMISVNARGGIPLEVLLDQLNSVPVCASYASRRASSHDVSRGSSCPTAVSYALKEMSDDIHKYIKLEETTEVAETVDTMSDPEDTDDANEEGCPICGSKELSHTNGCVSCPTCGWSRCS